MSEIEPCVSFQQKFHNKYGNNHTHIKICSLRAALERSCFADLDNRKMLALYLHCDDDAFSQVFCPQLANEKFINLLEVYCLFLAWDISDCTYHTVIKEMIKDFNELNFIEYRLINKRSGLLLITPVEDTITLFGILQGAKMKEEEIINSFSLYCESFAIELQCERTLLETRKQDILKINSKVYQQMMSDMLGDRDYDAFESYQHDQLKGKIGFAFYGPPQDINGYTTKQEKKIDAAYAKICEQYGPHAEYEGQIIISFIYNCTEPLPKEKEKRLKEAQKNKIDYDPETDILPLPIFVLRKCILSVSKNSNPCRIFIDHDLRVYNTWKEYITNNKLPPCKMTLPINGRYKANANGEVLLEFHLSPSSGIKADVLKGLDITSTVLGVGTGAVFAAALIPTITVAPLALAGAGIVGLGVGVYSLVRSAVNLADRRKYKEDLSLKNSEARGCYINIVAGSLGFVGAGAATALSQLVSQGINVGRAAQSTVTAINVINVGASGAGILHSGYEVYVQWRDDNVKPSALTIVQLSSSILFFGNAIYNFKTGSAIVEETQTKVLQEFQDGLRSNRHRKTFNKMRLETIRQNEGNVAAGHAEVIATIRSIPNHEEIFAVLTSSNKMFNKNNVKFASSNGKITLNGIPVDISKFGDLSKTQKTTFLLDLPATPTPSPAQTHAITAVVNKIFQLPYIKIYDQLVQIQDCNFATLLNLFKPMVQEMLLKSLKILLENVSSREIDLFGTLKNILPDGKILETVLQLVIEFYKTKTVDYEQDYVTQREQQKSSPDFNETDFATKLNASEDVGQRALIFFQRAVEKSFYNGNLTDAVLSELVKYFVEWLAQQVYRFETNREIIEKRKTAAQKKVCQICRGVCFSK